MVQDTRRVSDDAYVHYEFSCVKCSECGEMSNPFVQKDHLTADETIAYVEEITGFKVRKSEYVVQGFFVNSGQGYTEGGLACPKCQGIQKEEVA